MAEVGPTEVDASVAFMSALFNASTQPAAHEMPPASEACLSGKEVVRQLLDREAKLRAVAGHVLADFLDREFAPVRERLVEQAQSGYTKGEPRFLNRACFFVMFSCFLGLWISQCDAETGWRPDFCRPRVFRLG